MSNQTKYGPKMIGMNTDGDAPGALAGAVRIPGAITVKFHRLPHGEGLPLPAYETAGAVGMDLRCCHPVADAKLLYIESGATEFFHTGFAVEIPPGHEGQIRGRSGLARRGIFAHVGTIDFDFRGELCVLLHNTTDTVCYFELGDRIAQLVVAPVARANIVEVDSLSDTERGEGGFGSTGT